MFLEVKNNAFNRCLGCFLCFILSLLISTSFIFAVSGSGSSSDPFVYNSSSDLSSAVGLNQDYFLTSLNSNYEDLYNRLLNYFQQNNLNDSLFIYSFSSSGGIYYASALPFNTPLRLNNLSALDANCLYTVSPSSWYDINSNSYNIVHNTNINGPFAGSYIGSYCYGYLLDNPFNLNGVYYSLSSSTSYDWNIVNINGQSPIDTGTGLVIYSDIESSPYASRFQASPEIEVSHAFTQEDGDIVFYTTHFIDVKVDPSTGNLYTSTNYFGRSGSLGGSGFREGVLHTTSPVSPDGQWIATRNKDGLQIKKNVPFVVREGALLADSANKTLYFNDPSPSFPSSVTSVPTSSLYDLLLAWSKLNIASAQAAQAAISGVSAVLNDALYYTDTVSIGDESWSYSYSIANLVESIRWLLSNNFSERLIEPRYINNQSYQSVLHALNLQYQILSSFENIDSNGLPPQYIQVYGHRYDNPAYIVLGQLNDHFDAVATSIDNLTNALVGDGDVVFPDSDTTVQDDIFNTVLDPDSPISLQPGRVADAFNIMGDTSEFYTLDRPSFSFFSLFSNIDQWPLFTRETAANCGLDVDEDL